MSTFGSKLVAGAQFITIVKKFAKSAKISAIGGELKRLKENLADILSDYLNENRSDVAGL